MTLRLKTGGLFYAYKYTVFAEAVFERYDDLLIFFRKNLIKSLKKFSYPLKSDIITKI